MSDCIGTGCKAAALLKRITAQATEIEHLTAKLDECNERRNERRIETLAYSTKPLTGGNDRRHIVCLCPDCTKPAQPALHRCPSASLELSDGQITAIFQKYETGRAHGFANAARAALAAAQENK